MINDELAQDVMAVNRAFGRCLRYLSDYLPPESRADYLVLLQDAQAKQAVLEKTFGVELPTLIEPQ